MTRARFVKVLRNIRSSIGPFSEATEGVDWRRISVSSGDK